MKSSYYSAFLFTFLISLTFGQGINMEFSAITKLSPKKTGRITEFIGGTNNCIFSISKNIGLRTKKKYTYLVATDKTSMKEVARTPLYGRGTPRSVNLKKARIVKIFANKEGIVLIWAFKESKTSQIYKAEVLDAKFKNVGKLKELLNTEALLKGDREATIIDIATIQSEENKEDFCIVYEISYGKEKEIRMGYLKFDSKLDKVYAGKVTLPVFQIDKKAPSNLTGIYHYSKDGYIYSKHTVIVDDEKSKKFWKTGKSKIVLNRIEPESEQITEINIEHPKMSLTDVSFASNSKQSVIFGLFRDPDLFDGTSVNDGTFLVSFNERSKEVEDFKLSYFSKAQLDNIYHRKELTGRSKKKVDKKAAKAGAQTDGKMETARGNLVIEYADLLDNGELFFVASLMENYTVTVCSSNSSGQQSCREIPYCYRQDVNGIKLDKNGEILSAENIRRDCIYPGWFVYDVNILKKNNNYYAFYGTGSIMTPDGKRDKKKEKEIKKKEKREKITTMFYACFDNEKGKGSEMVYEIQQTSKKKKEKKKMNNLVVSVIDNELYSYNFVSALSPIKAPIAIASCFFILPMYYVLLKPSSYQDYYGTMVRVTGK